MENFFDYVLSELNNNDYNVKFEGNVFFQYHPYNNDFVIYDINEETLDIDTIPYVPLTESSSEDIPFVDEIERSDWNKSFVVPVKIGNNVTFESDNAIYLALEAFTESLNGKVFEYGDYKYNAKVSSPKPEGIPILKNGVGWFRLFTFSVSFTKIKRGFFGGEFSLQINGVDVDFISVTPSSGSDTRTERDLVKWSNNKSTPIARQTELEINFNYQGEPAEQAMLEYALGLGDINNTFSIYYNVFGTTYKNDNMLLINATPQFERGVVVTMLVKFVERGR